MPHDPGPPNRPTNLPKWTILYNLNPGVLNTQWVGMGWEFYDDETVAAARYAELIKLDHCPTKRPYYPTDAEHLGAAHTEAKSYGRRFILWLRSTT